MGVYIMCKYVFLLSSFISFEYVNSLCAPGCLDGWQSDGECDLECFNAACNWDGDDVCYGMSGDDDFIFRNDDNSYSGSCNILTCPGIFDGHCGAFQKETDKWCNYDGPGSSANICCAEDANECCESDGAAVGGTIGGVVAFLGFCFWYCCGRRRDNRNEKPPNCAYKLFCPPCAVFGYQGCENKSDAFMACCCCWFFTMCCWEPKQVIVDNSDNNNHDVTQCVEIVDVDIEHGERTK